MALDIQAAMFHRVQNKLKAQHVTNVRLLHTGAGEGKIESESFDRALLVAVLDEIPDKVAALRDIYRALKSGGILSITEIFTDPHFQRPCTIRKLAEETEFTVESEMGRFPGLTLNLVKPA